MYMSRTGTAPVTAAGGRAPEAAPGRRRRRSGAVALRFFGPAFVAAIAYVDPGNLATNVAAGAGYGYALLWVVVVADLLAMLMQYLSAKLGYATGRGLAELCRDRFGRRVRIGLWLQAEIVVMMTDLAEIVGGALALNMLFGLPPAVGGVLVVAAMSLILLVQQRGRRQFEAIVVAVLAVVLVAFLYETLRAHIDGGAALGGLVPRIGSADEALVAAGIVGATVMPHALYLHSSLTRGIAAGGAAGGAGPPPGAPAPDTPVPTPAPRPEPHQATATRRRGGPRGAGAGARLLRWDVLVALGIAGAANVAMLLGATPLRGTDVSSLIAAHAEFAVRVGGVGALVFAIALLASGVAASGVGVYSGQLVMQGFLHRSVPLWLRRLVSALPALALLLAGVDATRALLLSQVVLSFGIPFALFPLVVFTSDSGLMRDLANRRATLLAGWTAGGLIVALNGFLVVMLVRG